jgi:hypothetical protein
MLLCKDLVVVEEGEGEEGDTGDDDGIDGNVSYCF